MRIFAKISLVSLGAVVVLGFFYFMTLLSPGHKVEYNYDFVDPEMEALQLLRESERLEIEFEKSATANAVGDDDLAKLRKAIALQEVYIDKARSRDRTPADRLLKLQARLQNIQAAPLAAQVEEIEREAKTEADAERYEKAQEIYKRAYDIQSRINADYPMSKFKDVARAISFDRQSRMLMARPLYLQSIEAENAARAALEKKDWKTAQEQFEKAIEFLSQMNSNYPDSTYTDFARLQRLDIDLASLRSSSLEEKIEECLKRAKAEEDKGEFLHASEAYGDALEIQKNLNKYFPKSRHASEERVSELARKRTEAYSWKFGREIIDERKILDAALVRGDFNSAVAISNNLLRKTEQFRNDFPKSQMVDAEVLLSLRYINFMMRDIPRIQKLVLNDLAPVEGSAGLKMLKTEVTQQLYQMVMQENPSRYSDSPMNPVDSVTMDDVRRFCNRLSWILGRKVDLPSEAVFRKSAGSLRYVDLDEISWNNFNSDGRTHPVALKKPNDKGFYDMFGNVAEFMALDPDEADVGAKVIGGSAQSNTDSLTRFQKSYTDPKQRNRMVGFRIVVSDNPQK